MKRLREHERYSVLVAMRDPSNRRAITAYLRRIGYYVGEVDSAPSTMRAVVDGRYDIVVLDEELYGAGGEGTAGGLRASPVPAMVVTGITEAANRVRVVDLGAHERFVLGADDHVLQPCSLSELEARVRAVLRQSRSASTVRGTADAAGSS